jgi:hypothetical protein
VLQGAKELGKEEQQVAGDVNKLFDNQNPQERAQQLQSLTERKAQMADQLRDLKSRMDKLSLDSRRENKDAANGLAEASKTMRDHKTEEKIRASQGAIRYSGSEYSKSLEGAIGNDINDLQQRLEQVATAAREGAGKPSDQTAQSQALDRTRDLVRGIQSLDERMRNSQSGKRGNRQTDSSPTVNRRTDSRRMVSRVEADNKDRTVSRRRAATRAGRASSLSARRRRVACGWSERRRASGNHTLAGGGPPEASR